MTLHLYIRNSLVFVLILSTGVGLALLFPWLADAQGLAAHRNATAVGTCYATHDNGVTVFGSPDAKAVQDAVDAANPGDIVKVAGTCVGVQPRDGINQTVYISKSLRLEGGHTHTDWSLDPNPQIYTTTLDADRLGRVVVISGTISAALDSLRLTGGWANGAGLGNSGAGIWSNAEFSVTNSIVFSNTAGAFGGGYYSGIGSIPWVSKVTFEDNEAVHGGGIYHEKDLRPVLSDVSLKNNRADFGGGVFDNLNTRSVMTDVALIGNSATSFGGGIFNNGGTDSQYINMLLSGNAAKSGGGVYNNASNTRFRNATISGNSASEPGGGIANNQSELYLYNSIVWNNQANGLTGTITATVYNENNGIMTGTYSLIQSSGGSLGWILDPSYVDDGGNIDTDPLFITPISPTTAPTTTGNLRLQSNSPAIDVGKNDFVTVPTDLDGEPRVVDGNGDLTATVDMGAYEYQIPYKYDGYLPFIYR